MALTPSDGVTLYVRGQTIRTTAARPFYVLNRGWTLAADLRAGDRFLGQDGRTLTIEAVTRGSDGAAAPQPEDDITRCLRHGGLLAGTTLATPDGPKKVEDLRPGDQLLTRPPDDLRRN